MCVCVPLLRFWKHGLALQDQDLCPTSGGQLGSFRWGQEGWEQVGAVERLNFAHSRRARANFAANFKRGGGLNI